MTADLWVILPTYNEQDSIEGVLRDWASVLRATCPSFVLCLLNDGSRDDTSSVAHGLCAELPELLIVDKPNSGHGQTCLAGYRLALDSGARWILQIDSDGQCDPSFFPSLWRARDTASTLYGFRRERRDGSLRVLASRLTTVVVWLASGVWVRDANVPYRLMRREAVAAVEAEVPADFWLANVLVSVLHEQRFGIRWTDIVFRARTGGVPSARPLAMARRGLELFFQLREYRMRNPLRSTSR